MFTIKEADFAILYRTEMGWATPQERKRAEEFRLKNPQCPKVLKADTYSQAYTLNAQLFDYI